MEDYEFIVMLDFDSSNTDACPFKRTCYSKIVHSRNKTICEREEKGKVKKSLKGDVSLMLHLYTWYGF